ncbi:hypothetical protein [Nocardia abscessus]|nr:hypothetical protein [Nocardia abscessus]
MTGLRAAATPAEAAFEAQLWKFERVAGHRAYSRELETTVGS